MKSLIKPILALLALPLAGCDGYVGMAGSTYRWVDPPPGAKSFIVVDEALPQGLTLEPLSGVDLTLYYTSGSVRDKGEDARLWRDEVASSANGTFDMGGTSAPGEYESAIEARKDGCQSVLHRFEHDRHDHLASVVLVCDR